MREQIEILGVAVDDVDFATTLDQIDAWVGEHRAADAPTVGHQDPLDRQNRRQVQLRAADTTTVGQHHLAAAPACRQVCTVNPEFIVDANRNPAFAAVLQRADLRVPDGVGVLWAARLFGQPLPERVTGSDGIYHITARAAARGWRVFFLGAAPGVALQTATPA
ncbi:MAG: WecB/TagA/CpsF family glycosyltransferase [Anaerolineales bacterium]|nr:WecB/TagA/CpsF family glycosyltransferase [Anaerolineales bacterium]